MIRIVVRAEDFDAGAELRLVEGCSPGAGAVASFIGIVRPESAGEALLSMTLEHYPGMTEKALIGIVEQARARWEVLDCTVIHRYGRLEPTDQIVLVVVASGHRGDAFAACEFIMDFLKTRAPFWKKERTPEGERWVESRASDDAAAGRWQPGDPR